MKQLRHILPTVVRQLGDQKQTNKQTEDLNDLAHIKK